MKSRYARYSMGLLVSLLATTAAISPSDSTQSTAVSPAANCLMVGPTVNPPTSPSPLLPKRTDLGQPPQPTTSCLPPQTPSVSASQTVQTPTTNHPAQPIVNNAPPSPTTSSAPAKRRPCDRALDLSRESGFDQTPVALPANGLLAPISALHHPRIQHVASLRNGR